MNDGAWHYVAATFDNGVGVKVYLDGALAISGPAPLMIADTADPLQIGQFQGSGGAGNSDEARVSDTVRSAAWILTEYNNQKAPGNIGSPGFLTWGSELPLNSGVTATVTNWTPTSITATVPGGAATGNVLVTVGGIPSNGAPFSVVAGPSISGISPTTVAAGSEALTLIVNGSAFASGAVVNWTPAGGSTQSLATTFVSAGQLTAAVPASLVATAGSATVTVTSGGVTTNGLTFNAETISQPSLPTGQTTGVAGTANSYTAGGSTSSAGHPLQYQFTWADGTNSGWLPSGTKTASQSWTLPGTYNVAVVARCAIDNAIVSGFSASLAVSITAASPTVTLLTPTNGAANQALAPTLAWNAVSGATSYTIALGTPTPVAVATVTGTSYTPTPALSANTTYSWFVTANGGASGLGSSATWSFTTLPGAPSMVNLSAPANGASGQPLTPQLTWAASPAATSYDVALGSPTPTVVATVLKTSFIPPSALSGSTIYTWYVVAKNNSGSAVPSPSWSFTTAPGPPSQVTLVSPTSSAVQQPLTPTLSWNAVPGATSYSVSLGTPTPVVVATVASTTFTPPAPLSPESTYSWYVVANNPGGSAAPSSTWTFTTDPPPNAPPPPYPSREYVYLGSRVLAIENSASISGQVLQGGAGLGGVTITLSGSQAQTTTTTATDGTYSFANLPPGPYVVSPSLTGQTFTPPASPVTAVTNLRLTQGFATSPNTYSISGSVSGASCTSGVTMTLSGNAQVTATTAGNGAYSLSGLLPGSYTLTPSASGCSFSPTSTSITIANGNVTASTFTGTANAYSITGSVSGTSCSSGVTLTLSGSAQGTTTTGTNGSYVFTEVPGTYTITPSASGCSFSPTSTSVTIANGNVTASTFMGTGNAYSITGSVSGTSCSIGVTLTLSGSAQGTTTTGTNGSYAFTELAGAYTITPSKSGCTFSPASTNISVTNGNVSAATFTGTPNTYSISGTLSGVSSCLSNVTMTLSGAAQTTVSASGSYLFGGLLPGSYTITPSASGCSFSPASATVSVAGSNLTANFTAVLPLTITTGTNLGSVVGGTFFGVTLVATGGTFPYTWSGSSLPNGMSVSSTGTLSGTTPTALGTYSFTVTVTDSSLPSALRTPATFSFTVSTGTLAVTADYAAVYAGTSEQMRANASANWSLSGQGSLTPTSPQGVTSCQYNAPGAVVQNQTCVVTAAAGGQTSSLTLLMFPPTPAVSPTSGTFSANQPVLFTFSGSQGDNWSNVNDYLILDISPNTTFQQVASCQVQYEPAYQGGTVYLFPDTNNSPFIPSGRMGSNTILSNSQCSINLSAAAGASQSASGPNVTVQLPITFKSSYTGSKTVMAQAYPDTDNMTFTLGSITIH